MSVDAAGDHCGSRSECLILTRVLLVSIVYRGRLRLCPLFERRSQSPVPFSFWMFLVMMTVTADVLSHLLLTDVEAVTSQVLWWRLLYFPCQEKCPTFSWSWVKKCILRSSQQITRMRKRFTLYSICPSLNLMYRKEKNDCVRMFTSFVNHPNPSPHSVGGCYQGHFFYLLWHHIPKMSHGHLVMFLQIVFAVFFLYLSLNCLFVIWNDVNVFF